MTGTSGVKSFETLDVQVKALEGDVRDIKTGMASLGAEIRQALSAVTSQFTQQLASVTTQLAQQQRTPWASVGSIGSVLVVVIGFIVFQTITPMQTDIKNLKDEVVPRVEYNFRHGALQDEIKIMKDQIVPRVEHNFRQAATDRMFDDINKRLEQTQSRKYEDMTKTIDRLELENRELRHKP